MANYTIIDDRDEADVEVTAAFVIATDSWMSGTGVVPGRSIVARPIPRERTARVCRSSDGKNHWYYVVNTEELMRVRELFDSRPTFERVRVVYGDKYRPVLKDGDHLHIYGFDTFTKE